MFLLQQPAAAKIESFLTAQQDASFSYAPVGLTQNPPAKGYNVDHTRVRLGSGEAVFQTAIAALQGWKMFDFAWLQLYPATTPIKREAVVAVVVSHLGCWSMNACRIVYIVESSDEHCARYGFAYGTLRDHAERGEERFMIEWDKREDAVWYDILAVSKPGLLASLGYWYARRLQQRFARDSAQAMAQAILNQRR